MKTDRFTVYSSENPISRQRRYYVQDNGTTILQFLYEKDCENVCSVLNDFNKELTELKDKNESLRLENHMLKVTNGRNESYIKDITHKMQVDKLNEISKSKLLEYIDNRIDFIKSLQGDFGQHNRIKDLRALEYKIHNGDFE